MLINDFDFSLRKNIYALLCWVAVALMPFAAQAAEPISTNWLGVVIQGHDTVAYHLPESIAEHQRTKGERTFSVDWKGGKWHFANAQHAQAFAAEPEKYAPAYNGHCANALSLGEGLIDTDGKTWEIYQDQLFVFYAPRGRERWNNGNYLDYKADADKAWAEIINNRRK